MKGKLKAPPDMPHETKQELFYAGGYIAFKHLEHRGNVLEFDEDLTSYLDILDRGNLSYPSPELFQLTLFAYAFFEKSKERMCINRFLTILKVFPDYFDFNINLETKPLRRLANILFKRLSLFTNEVLKENTAVNCKCKKINKLSSKSNKN